MSERKLAHIEKIDSISPIKDADFVVMALIQGYETVVKKDDFREGDLIVYIECDSLCHETPDFEFLRGTKFKIKIRKFKGQISMGLVMPLSILPKGNYNIGDDVTELLQIRNYVKMQEDKEEFENISNVQRNSRSVLLKILMKNSSFRKIYLKLNTISKGDWPDWGVSKTDEVRIQNECALLLDHFDEEWYITEKLNGSSQTFFHHKIIKWGFPKWIFGVCSRNIWLKTPDNSNFWKVVKKYDLEKRFKRVFSQREAVIQGELLAPNIQKNQYKVEEPEFYVFNYIRHGVRQGQWDMLNISKILGLKTVPIINHGFVPSEHIKSKDIKDVVNYMLEYSKGKSKLCNVDREGIVCRLVKNPDISFKVINPDFLLKSE